MQKKILGITVISLVLLVVAVLAVTPLVIGRNVQEFAITNSIALLPPEMRAQVDIRENEFIGGWWRSNARLDVEYMPLGGLPLRMRLEMQIQHGPLLFTPDGLALGLVYANIDPSFDSAEIRDALRELPFPLPDMTFALQVELNGDTRVGMEIAPVSHADGNGELEFAGIDALLVAYADQSAVFNLSMGKLSAQEYGSGFQFSIDELSMHTSSAQINNLLATSAASINIPVFSSTTPYPIEIADFVWESRVQPAAGDETRTDLYQRLEIGQITSDLSASAFSWTSEFNDTRNELFQQYYALLIRIQDEMNASGGMVTAGVTESAEELVMLLLRNSIVLNNSIATTMYAGDHTVALRIIWRGLPDLAEFARLDMNAAIAAMDLTFDVALDLDAILRSPMAELVDPYVQEGYLQLDNGRILMRAAITDGELLVNGERIALEDIL